MSSSKPQSDSTPQGECVVCGKLSYLRCSECAKHGLEWMWFCSVEHQRFIWYAHKRTCGVNSMPFQWPFLTEDEKVEWRKLKNVKYSREEGEVEWEKQLLKIGLSFEGMLKLHDLESWEEDRLTDYLADSTASMVRSRTLKYRIWQEEALRTHKSSAPSVLGIIKICQSLKQDLYSYLAFQLDYDWPELPGLVAENLNWWTTLHHRFLILVAILCQHYQNPELYNDHTIFVKHAISQVRKVLREQVSRDFPLESRKLESLIDSIILETRHDSRVGRTIGLWFFSPR